MADAGSTTAAILPPVVRDERGLAFAAAVDRALAVNVWQACPARVGDAADEVLWELARQYDVAGPLYRAMRDREARERLVRVAWELQRKRGTRWAVAEIMRLLGYSDAAALDRTGLLKYDGEAIHNGDHYFNAGFGDWREYRMRLFLEEGSLAFCGKDLEQAAALLAAWAPLRSRLVGWNVRHVLTTCVPNPRGAASDVSTVVLMDRGLAEQEVGDYWVQPRQDGSVVIRWRLEAEHIALPEISTLAIRLQGGGAGEELDRRSPRTGLPTVARLDDLTYEGEWTLKEAR